MATSSPRAKSWRRFFRFSLLTLLLFMFLLGSGGLFWQRIRWGAWKRTVILPRNNTAEIYSLHGGEHVLIKEPVQPAALLNIRDGTSETIYGSNGGLVSFSSDGRQFLTAADNGVAVWDVSAGTSRVLEGIESRKFSAWDFSPRGARVANADGTRLSVRDTATGKLLWSQAGSFDYRVAVSNDGKWVATCRTREQAPQEIQLLSIEDGSLIRNVSLADADQIYFLRFSPRDDMLLIGDKMTPANPLQRYGTRIVETSSFKEIGRFDTVVNAFPDSFSPDGRYLALGDADGLISFDFKTGKQSRPTKAVGSNASFSPSGNRVVTDNGKLFNYSEAHQTFDFGRVRRARFVTETMIVTEELGPGPEDWAARDIVTVCRWDRQYPEDGLGRAGIWEFWLMLAFAAACAWSVWRDRSI